MNSPNVCQAWGLVRNRNFSVHKSRGNLTTITNDSSSGFAVRIAQNGKIKLKLEPGQSHTLSTLPGDRLEVLADPRTIQSMSASGHVLF